MVLGLVELKPNEGGSMDLSGLKEGFSLGYIQAVAAAAGCTFERTVNDRFSIDAMLSKEAGGHTYTLSSLGIQAKCTAAHQFKKGVLKFSLSRKNYEDLSDPMAMFPRILVVLLVPRAPEQWIVQRKRITTVKHCAFWTSLRGLPPMPEDAKTVSVRILEEHVFSSAALHAMMKRIGDGGVP